MMKRGFDLQCTPDAAFTEPFFQLLQIRKKRFKSGLAPWYDACASKGINISDFKEPGFRISVENFPVLAQIVAQNLQLLLRPRAAEHFLLRHRLPLSQKHGGGQRLERRGGLIDPDAAL